MACQSCKRQLSQVSRQTPALFTESQSIAIANRLSRPLASQNQQRRTFKSTRCERSFVPKSVKDVSASLLQSTAQPYQVHRATETIYKACAREAAYTISETDRRNGTILKDEDGVEIGKGSGTWHNDLGLPATFSTWSHVTMLHLYLIFARFRNLERETAKAWQKPLTDHFFFDAEERMDMVHGITSRGLRHKYLKDLFIQWRGIIAAYDEGVTKGDAVLASAVWRNIYKGREDVDVRHLAAIVSWMRLCLKLLDRIPDEALFFEPPTAFKWPPKNQLNLVDEPVKELQGLLPSQGVFVPKEGVSQGNVHV